MKKTIPIIAITVLFAVTGAWLLEDTASGQAASAVTHHEREQGETTPDQQAPSRVITAPYSDPHDSTVGSTGESETTEASDRHVIAVVDGRGAAVEGVQVTITNSSGAPVGGGITDEAGEAVVRLSGAVGALTVSAHVPVITAPSVPMRDGRTTLSIGNHGALELTVVDERQQSLHLDGSIILRRSSDRPGEGPPAVCLGFVKNGKVRFVAVERPEELVALVTLDDGRHSDPTPLRPRQRDGGSWRVTVPVSGIAPSNKILAEGMVLDAGGDPVPGATVEVTGAGRGQDVTDREGRFLITGPDAEGPITVIASASAHILKRPVHTRAGGQGITVPMTRSASLSGSILLPSAVRSAEVRVNVIRATDQEEIAVLEPRRTVGEERRFQARDLVSGEYRVEIRDTAGDLVNSSPQVYVDGEVELAVIDLRERFPALTIRTKDSQGRPRRWSRVEILGPDGATIRSAAAGPGAVIRTWGKVAGETIRVRAPGARPKTLQGAHGAVEIRLEDATEVHVRLDAPPSVGRREALEVCLVPVEATKDGGCCGCEEGGPCDARAPLSERGLARLSPSAVGLYEVRVRRVRRTDRGVKYVNIPLSGRPTVTLTEVGPAIRRISVSADRSRIPAPVR